VCAVFLTQLLAQFPFYLFNLSGHSLNDPVVIEVHHWFVADGTLEEELRCLLEGESLAAGRLAAVKLVAFLVLKPGFQFFKYTALLVQDEAFQLVGLESPVEDKPACFFVARLPERHKGVVIESVERPANRVEAYLGFIRYLVVCNLVNPSEDLNDSNSVLAEQRSDLL